MDETNTKRTITSVSLSDKTIAQAEWLQEELSVGSRSSTVAVAIREMYDKYVSINRSQSGE